MNGYPPPIVPLAPEPTWKATKTPEGKEYYFNAATGVTTWEKPQELWDEVEVCSQSFLETIANITQRNIVGTGWTFAYTDEQKRYYYHKDTKNTQWTVPDEVQQKIDREKQNQPPQRPPPAGPAGWGAGPPAVTSYQDDRRLQRDEYRPDRHDRRDERERDRESGFGGERPNISFTTGAELQFATPQEAEATFMKVLRQMKVQPDWSWQQAVRAGIHDPNWRAIPEPEKREEAFKKYCEDLRAQEKHKEQERQAKLRSDFTAMLRSHPEIKYYTRWKTALPIIEEETIYRSAKDETERRTLFDEYIILLKKAHEQEEAESRRSALDEMMDLLKGLDLEPFTQWEKAEDQLEHNDEFNNERFQALSRMDVLSQFEQHIRQLQREHNERVQAERHVKNRIERKNRDGFVELLEGYRQSGTIRAGTKWKDFHPTIKDDPRYLAMLGQGGSSPLDLFWDVLEQEDSKFRSLRRKALDALEVGRHHVPLSDSRLTLLLATTLRGHHVDPNRRLPKCHAKRSSHR
jgi:pre-mRNA-processing factor 40